MYALFRSFNCYTSTSLITLLLISPFLVSPANFLSAILLLLFIFLDATECTAMHFAAGRGDTDMVDLLIAGGATVGE